MEIVWVDRRDGSDRFYLAFPRCLSREQVFIRAKVTPGSYAGRLVERLYRNIFEMSLELKRDYNLYYQLEYDTFYRYLRRRLLLSKDEAAIIAPCFEISAAIIEYKPRHYFLRDDPGRALLEKLLTDEEAE
jgi:hypothetical protein